MARGQHNRARIRFLQSGQDFQQGGFSGPVFPGEADPVLVLDDERNIVEKGLPGKGYRELIDGNHV